MDGNENFVEKEAGKVDELLCRWSQLLKEENYGEYCHETSEEHRNLYENSHKQYIKGIMEIFRTGVWEGLHVLNIIY